METNKVCERNWPHTAGATAKRFSSTTEYTEQYSTSTNIHCRVKFIFLIRVVVKRIRPCRSFNIRGQYSINIPAQSKMIHNPSAGLRTPFPRIQDMSVDHRGVSRHES